MTQLRKPGKDQWIMLFPSFKAAVVGWETDWMAYLHHNRLVIYKMLNHVCFNEQYSFHMLQHNKAICATPGSQLCILAVQFNELPAVTLTWNCQRNHHYTLQVSSQVGGLNVTRCSAQHISTSTYTLKSSSTSILSLQIYCQEWDTAHFFSQ